MKNSNISKPKKVLLLGSGPLQIGQAGEFDYSGTQALKALKEEGIYTVLINPNIATVQTNDNFADKVYFLPVETHIVENILETEKCDSILLSFGGQTALNTGLELYRSGVFKRLNVKVLGTTPETINDTEDRNCFAARLAEIGIQTARGKSAHSFESALQVAQEIAYPVMIRCGFSLGGQGASVVYNEDQCIEIARQAFSVTNQILIEECLFGWKEIEYEVMRDHDNNCITVCNMENIDPVGIHTGDSIVIAPSQTLDDFEYQNLREIAIKTIRHLKIIGECNIQYAVNPRNREYRVIEVNARLSRSSSLASKATGYPLAYVAAKVVLGYRLDEIPNVFTGVTSAFFEPALDYIVCKVPRWDLNKFNGADNKIGCQMKSVGEAMAIGRNFSEAFQKALRMVEIGVQGFDSSKFYFEDIEKEISTPSPHRIFAIAQALSKGMTTNYIHRLTHIDLFFLDEMKKIITLENEFKSQRDLNLKTLTKHSLTELKRHGFSDKHIANILGVGEADVFKKRKDLEIRPYLSQIDTLAAEYPTKTNFLYFTYSAAKMDIVNSSSKKIIILGSGCFRIGSSIEFDWCGSSSVEEAHKLGYEVIYLNCNPETVSTDYDTCDKLVFDEISIETILELYDFIMPEGIIISFGGQTSNNLASKLYEHGLKIFGTSPRSIDLAENRNKFSTLLDSLDIHQPKWTQIENFTELKTALEDLGGFPVLVRPSYVLSGSAMKVANNEAELGEFLNNAREASPEYPVVMSKFEMNAKEIEFDGVAQNGNVILSAICEHIEYAGTHSGDATLVFPSQTLSTDIVNKINDIASKVAYNLKIHGPFNIQLLLKYEDIKIIELNIRASRSFPFISKALGINFVHTATKIMLLPDFVASKNKIGIPNYISVKAPKFSFGSIKGCDATLGVEMASTGEAACFGSSFEDAFLKAYVSCGFKIPNMGVFVEVDSNEYVSHLLKQIYSLKKLGLKIYSRGLFFEKMRVLDESCIYVSDNLGLINMFSTKIIDWVVSIPKPHSMSTNSLSREIRRAAIDMKISLTTDLNVAFSLINSLLNYRKNGFEIYSRDHYITEKQKCT